MNNTNVSLVNSFDERSTIYLKESSWGLDYGLNQLCIELIENDIDIHDNFEILDYGSGPGALSRLLAQRGHVVDVADISSKMIEKCEFSRKRFLIPRDIITGKYDRIILRQVLQYFSERDWLTQMELFLSWLRPGGRLLFSQMVPFSAVDHAFWVRYNTLRRPQRVSFPTAVEFLDLCKMVRVNQIKCIFSDTITYLNEWLLGASEEVRIELLTLFASASPEIRSLRAIQGNGSDITWKNHWVHILVQKE